MAGLKVCVIGPGPKYLSGISYFTWKLTSTLEATPLLFRDMLPKFLFPGKKRVGLVSNRITYQANLPTYIDWWNPLTWIKAILVCRKHDIIVLEWWTASVAHLYAFILAFCWRSVVVEVHETIDPLESKILPIALYARLMRRLVWGRADKLVVHSSVDAQIVLAMYPKEEKYQKVVIIPHGVYDQYETIQMNRPPEFTVLFLGLVREYKGVKHLISGFIHANLPESRLIIAGEQWDKLDIPKLPKLTKPYKIYSINKYLSDGEIEFYMSQADVVVLPYLRASSSGVAHIAMHYGLPIIATHVGGMRELVDYQGIHYVRPGDSYQIAEMLRHIYYNTRNKRFPVPKRLEWSEIKIQWMKLFNEMHVGR